MIRCHLPASLIKYTEGQARMAKKDVLITLSCMYEYNKGSMVLNTFHLTRLIKHKTMITAN